MAPYDISGIDLGLDSRGAFITKEMQDTLLSGGTLSSCSCFEYSTKVCDCGFTNGCECLDFSVLPVNGGSSGSGSTGGGTGTSGTTNVNVTVGSTNYLDVCVLENNCKLNKVLKIVSDENGNETNRQLLEPDAQTAYTGSGVIVKKDDDPIISTQIIPIR